MKISVALASYNGEQYIREQLQTILNQTVPVDEIIISDDGSNDSTIEVVNAFRDPRIRVLTDNPNHGYCGNFEWAIKHTTGDIIFLADQDDIWMENKVEKCVDVFRKYSDVNLVITDGVLINKFGERIEGVFSKILKGFCGKIERSQYLLPTIWIAPANGMCMCFRKKLKEDILPFPSSTTCHDRWIAFCAICNNQAYYLNEELVKYRIHDSNTSMRGNISFSKRWNRAFAAAYNEPINMVNMAIAMKEKLRDSGLENEEFYQAALQLEKLHYRQIQAFKAFPLAGVFDLVKMYHEEKMYRVNGVKYLASQALLILFGRAYMKKHKRM